MTKRILSILLSLCLGTSLMIGCAPKDHSEEKNNTVTEQDGGESSNLPVLKVAVMPFLNSVPVKYMVDNKLDEKNGFKIETVYFANGGAMNEALAANQWEVGTLSAAAVNSLAIYGAYCLAEVQHSEGGIYTLVNKDSQISKIKGENISYPEVYGNAETIKGSIIATNTGTVSHLNVIKWIEKFGLTQDDVEIVHMDFPSAYQALKTGNCDVAALNPPTSYSAEAEGFMISSSLGNLDVPQYDSIIASSKTFNDKSDLLKKYIKAFYEATDALQADSEMAAQLLYDWYVENGSEATLEACKSEIETRPFVTSEEARNIKLGESVQITAEFWVEQGLLEESKFPEVEKHVNDTLVKEVLSGQ